MEVSGDLHATADVATEPIGQQDEWTPEPVWT
jgi:hypothetical protein